MKDRKIYCLNNIAKVGTDHFRAGYELADSMDDAAGVLVRSADMKEMEFPKDLRAIARAGAGVNNIPIDRCTESGIVVFNTPGANANSVKELVLCGMLLDMSADMDLVRFAVVGVGLNIADYPRDPALTHVTCLNDAAGRPLERAEVIARFLASFERWYDLWSLNGPHAILAPYTERCITVGSRVRVVGLKDDFEGEALRVTPDGSLVVMTDAGEETVVRAGDVSVRGVMGYV